MASVLGAQLYTIRDHTKTAGDMRASMERVRGLGYEAVQVSGQGADTFLMRRSPKSWLTTV